MAAAPPGPPELEIAAGRATIRLNRPARHNRLEIEDLVVLDGLFQRLEQSPDIRVAILTAAGPTFSSGYDMNALVAENGPPIRFEAVVDRLEALPMPTICRFNGSVYGGSTDLGLACDFRIGVEGMRMLMPAARLGVQYYPSGLRRYVDRLGIAAAKRLFLTAETIDGAEMLRIGYLDRLVPNAELTDAVDRLATSLTEMSPRAVRGMKKRLNEIVGGTLDRAAAQAEHEASLRSADVMEGLAAFAEKRKPVFR